MTEKRFIIDEYFEIGSVVIDTENENIRFKHENELSMKQCCDLLNELHEENQDSHKKEVELGQNYLKLLEENEQLRKENQKLIEYGRELLEYINAPPKHRKSIFDAVVCFKNKKGDME